MSDQIKVDFSKVTVGEYLEFQSGLLTEDSFSALMRFGEKAVIGGIMNRPMTDVPMIMSQLTKHLQEEADDITIAVTSMQNYLKSGTDE